MASNQLAHARAALSTCGAAQVNPNSYYDTMGRPGQRGGERERQLATFARNAVVAAEASKPAHMFTNAALPLVRVMCASMLRRRRYGSHPVHAVCKQLDLQLRGMALQAC